MQCDVSLIFMSLCCLSTVAVGLRCIRCTLTNSVNGSLGPSSCGRNCEFCACCQMISTTFARRVWQTGCLNLHVTCLLPLVNMQSAFTENYLVGTILIQMCHRCLCVRAHWAAATSLIVAMAGILSHTSLWLSRVRFCVSQTWSLWLTVSLLVVEFCLTLDHPR